MPLIDYHQQGVQADLAASVLSSNKGVCGCRDQGLGEHSAQEELTSGSGQGKQ